MGQLQVKAIDEYIEAFDMFDRTGRLFRKLHYDKVTCLIRGTNQVIGKNILSKYATMIALHLGILEEQAK